LPDAYWLDVDLDVLPQAANHFNRYIIMDQVKLSDASGAHARCGVSGPRAAEIAERLGVPQFAGLAPLDCVRLSNSDGLLFRHDFAGGPGFELILPRDFAGKCWDQLVEFGATPAGFSVLDALRIEAGIPWFGRELDNTVLPAETGAGLRGVNYQKGCYIGQEIVERMRTRGVVSRRLVQIRAQTGDGLVLPEPLTQDGREAGRLTSLVPHPIEVHWVGLGFLRTNLAHAEHITAGAPKREITVLADQPAGVAHTK
jgi:folate-binding protein YgfZ